MKYDHYVFVRWIFYNIKIRVRKLLEFKNAYSSQTNRNILK